MKKSKKTKKDSLGNRMKGYEDIPKNKLMCRTPVILRLDGKAFHTFTRGCNKPFDDILHETMIHTTLDLCKKVQNCVFAYTQSDEISLLLKDWETLTTEAWFDNEIQKMVSISAAIATRQFNHFLSIPPYSQHIMAQKSGGALFDSRAFNLPFEEVINYFIWRQQDATRNSIQMLGQSQFSQKQMEGKNNSKVQDMLMLDKGINWNDIKTWQKRGSAILKTENGFVIDKEMPILTQDRDYIGKYLER